MTCTQLLSGRASILAQVFLTSRLNSTTLVFPAVFWIGLLHQPQPHTFSEQVLFCFGWVCLVFGSQSNSSLLIHLVLCSFLPTKLCFTGFLWWVFACLFYLVRHLQALSYASSARGSMSLHHDILNIQINEKFNVRVQHNIVSDICNI